MSPAPAVLHSLYRNMEAKSDRLAKCKARLHRLESCLPVASLMLPDLFPVIARGVTIVAALTPTCMESLQKWRGFNYTDFEIFKNAGARRTLVRGVARSGVTMGYA